MEAFGSTGELADALVQANPGARSLRKHPLSMAAIAAGSYVGLTARMLDSPAFRFVVLITILTGGLGALALAVSVEEPSPAATLLAGLVIGVLVGDLIGATRVRRRHALSVDRSLG